jgi:Tol biopolymer transport system component
VREQGTQAAIYLTPPMPGAERKLSDVQPVGSADRTTVSWFPDGKRLVVAERDADGLTSGIFLIPIEPGAKLRVVSNPIAAGAQYFPAVSPDGKALAYGLCPAAYSCDVHVSDLGSDLLAKGSPKRLTHQATSINGIASAADGKSVIYGSFHEGVGLWRVSLSPGSNPQRLELASKATGYPAVARVGNKLAYPAGGRDVNVWKVQPGAPPESILSSTLPDFDPQLSQDGNRIAFVTDRNGKGNEIWLANADGTDRSRLTQATGRSQGSPHWSPNNRRIAYDAQAENGHWDVYVVDATGGRTDRLTQDASDESRPSWSRDGKWIYFESNRTRRTEIWRMPATGGGGTQVTLPRRE